MLYICCIYYRTDVVYITDQYLSGSRECYMVYTLHIRCIYYRSVPIWLLGILYVVYITDQMLYILQISTYLALGILYGVYITYQMLYILQISIYLALIKQKVMLYRCTPSRQMRVWQRPSECHRHLMRRSLPPATIPPLLLTIERCVLIIRIKNHCFVIYSLFSISGHICVAIIHYLGFFRIDCCIK